MNLRELGWDGAWQRLHLESDNTDLQPRRVGFAAHGRFKALGGGGEMQATLAGAWGGDGSGPSLPAVGDWVLVEPTGPGQGVIRTVLERRGCIARAESGGRKRKETAGRQQVIAANVDTVWVVCGLDRDYNPRRIERYVALSYGAGADPVVVLNKTDLCADAGARSEEIEALIPFIRIFAVSALDGTGFDQLAHTVTPGKTLCLLGSSGAGKSTIINRLLGTESRPTSATSSVSGKGRHTTTGRELILLPEGGVVIDTPGMRELSLILDPEELARSFSDIAERARDCRFADCSHTVEPGCAVADAVAAGDLAGERLENYHKLGRELLHRQQSLDKGAAAAERQKWKAIRKEIRRHYRSDERAR